MAELSHYVSRTGKLTCTPEQVFDFVTDIRNFEQFIPAGKVNNWQADKDSCGFSVSMIGNVSFRLTEKERATKVVYSGDALQKNDFSLMLDISSGNGGNAEVKVLVDAELNPMLRMLAEKPINKFLELLIEEMENFKKWDNSGV